MQTKAKPSAKEKIAEGKQQGKKRYVYVYLMHCLDGGCGSRNICQLLNTGQFGFVSGVPTCSVAVV